MQNIQDRIPLPNGTSIPCLGFGTWRTPDAQATACVAAALQAGYRHIDTAAIYGNERAVGEGIIASGVPRSEIFLTTKLWNADQGYQTALDACDESLRRLQTDYVDLYLIHWPYDHLCFSNWEEKNIETWSAFEDLYKAGKVRAIGLSNFLPHHIENLRKHWTIQPMVEQIELHPGMTQAETVAYCRSLGMVIEGWSPMGSGKVFSVPEMQALARKYDRSIAQICIRWSVQHGFIPLPKTATVARVAENAQVFDFTIDADDMALLDNMTACGWSGLHPDRLHF